MASVSPQAAGTVQFGTFELDLRAGELRRNGSKVKLQEQPFQILTMLLERPGELVTREELQKKLWPSDVFVDFDHSLNAAIRRLRDALGDSAENPRFVQTVARRGYRFVAPVSGRGIATPRPEVMAAPAISRRWFGILTALGVLLVGAGIASITHWRPQSVHVAAPIRQRRLTASSEENPVLGAVISPNGKFLAFADKTGLYLRQIDSGETHPLNFPSEFHAVPAAWYPDGSHLVAVWVEGPTTPPSLWQVSIMGGTPRKLIDDAQLPAVSPDGSQIAFVKGASKHSQGLWEMGASGENPRQLQTCEVCSFGTPTWSPDGQEIAYVSGTYIHDWILNPNIKLLNLKSGREETIFSTVTWNDGAASSPNGELGSVLVWTPDNRLIYSISEPPPNQNDSNPWSVPLDSRGHFAAAALRLTATPDWVAGLSASADGKRITFTKNYLNPGIYISEVSPSSTLSPPRRLTLDSWRDYPFAWTADNRAVLFSSDRDGSYHIFKQQIDQSAPELLIGGTGWSSLPRLAPDNSTLLFEVWPGVGEPGVSRRVMRTALTGGPPQLVLQPEHLGNIQCARPPSDLCLYDTRNATKLSFFRFDPLTGKSEELPQIRIQDQDSYAYNWTLSPDGKILALARGKLVQRPAEITFLSLRDGSRHTVAVPAWAGIRSIDFAADGRSVWAPAYTNTGKSALLNIDLQGRAKTVLEDSEMTIGWAIPSPDGKHLAFWKARGTSNVWLLEDSGQP